MSEPEGLVTLATFDSLSAAELARGILEDEGFRCFLGDAETVSMDWLISGAVGGIKLLVHQDDFMAAERLLNSRRPKPHGSGLDDYGLPAPTMAITKDPLVRDEIGQDKDDFGDTSTIEDEEHEDEQIAEAERYVRSALRCAVFGLILCPPLLQLYSLYMLFEAAQLRQESGGPYPKMFWFTAILDAAVILLALALLMATFVGGMTSGRL